MATKNLVRMLLGIIILLSFVFSGFCEPLIPENMVIENDYIPGTGEPIGVVEQVEGKAVIIHKDADKGFYAQKNNMLFIDDTVFTLENSRIQFKLNDESILMLASNTKIKLNHSVYNPAKKIRSSFININTGKVRFLVREMSDFKRSEFKIKTGTSIIGVRGSYFVIMIRKDESVEVMTLDEITRLKIETKSAVSSLGSLEKCVINEGTAQIFTIEKLTPDEKEIILREFTFKIELTKTEIDQDGSSKKSASVLLQDKLIPTTAFIRLSEDRLIEPSSWKSIPKIDVMLDHLKIIRDNQQNIIDRQHEGVGMSPPEISDFKFPDKP